MKKEEIGLEDFCKNLGYLHIKIDKEFLRNLLYTLSKDKKPHYNKVLIEELSMKCTKDLKYCGTIYGWTAYNKTIPLNKLAKIMELSKTDWSEAESKIKSIKSGQHGGEVNLKLPIKIDKVLGSIIGHILGDGSIDSRYQQVFFSNSNKDLLQEFANNMHRIFGINPRIWMQKAPDFGHTKWDKRLKSIKDSIEGRNVGLFYPTICGLILNSIFDNFAIGKDKRITKEIIQSNKDFKRGLIRAFYDDEGSISLKGDCIRLFQDRKEMLQTFRDLLKEFSITSGDIKKYIKKDKERYYFSIHRKSNFGKFAKEIGFTSIKKKERLLKSIIVKRPDLIK